MFDNLEKFKMFWLSKRKIVFRARKLSGSFEKRTPESNVKVVVRMFSPSAFVSFSLPRDSGYVYAGKNNLAKY